MSTINHGRRRRHHLLIEEPGWILLAIAACSFPVLLVFKALSAPYNWMFLGCVNLAAIFVAALVLQRRIPALMTGLTLLSASLTTLWLLYLQTLP